ncbi:MAG TPA: alpha/beta hydrolase [Candidatus Blautia stercoravium]|nr:alpha/beta hydrolase [Candidatus Blautia stercoravium]
MKKKHWKRIGIAAVVLLLIIYLAAANFLVSAALVPSTMEKLDAFSRITEDSMEALVQTDDIEQQNEKAWEETEKWAESAKGEKVTKTSEDGYKLVAQEIYASSDSHQWALILHGYTGWKEEMYPFAAWYNQNDFHVLVPDMRCQGESEGDFIGMGWTDRKDNLMWIQYILEKDPSAEIVIHGQSMGAAAALMLTGEKDLPDNVKAVISDCAYTDAYEMFRQKMKEWFHLPAFPLLDTANLMLQLRGGYDLKKASALEAVKKSHVPTLFIHGDEDKMIDVGMAKQLYEAAACTKELLIVEGAGHAQSQDKDPETYYGTIQAFLQKNTPASFVMENPKEVFFDT